MLQAGMDKRTGNTDGEKEKKKKEKSNLKKSPIWKGMFSLRKGIEGTQCTTCFSWPMPDPCGICSGEEHPFRLASTQLDFLKKPEKWWMLYLLPNYVNILYNNILMVY